MHVYNRTHLCVPIHPYRTRALRIDAIETVVVHRLSLARDVPQNPRVVDDSRLDGECIADGFIGHKQMGTGGEVPYHVLVRQDATVEQLLPLIQRGAHAIGYNARSWAVAVAGNWDETAMPTHICEAMIDVVATLAVLPMNVHGHTELAGASKDPKKRCPGRFVNMDEIREAVRKRFPPWSYTWNIRDRLRHIVEAGFTL